MDLDDIFLLDHESLIKFIRCHSSSNDVQLVDNDIEEQQSIALSILLNPFDINEFKFDELSTCFSQDKNELLRVLYESTNFKLNQTIHLELSELFDNERIESLMNLSIKKRITLGTILISIEEDELPIIKKFSCSNIIENGQFNVNVIAMKCTYFGYYQFLLYYEDQSQRLENVLCTSRVYNYSYQLELFLDLFYWGYRTKDKTLSTEFENSLLELCIHVNEELITTVQRLIPMFSMMGNTTNASDMVTEMNKMIETIQCDIAAALSDHSIYAIGRLHQTLGQLLEFGSDGMSVFALPPACVSAIYNFITVKTNFYDLTKFNNSLMELYKAVEDYLAAEGGKSPEASRLSAFLSTFQTRINDFVSGTPIKEFSDSEIRSISKDLRAKPFETIPNHSTINTIATYMPIIPLDKMTNILSLDVLATVWAQSLAGDIIQIGSMLGTSLGDFDVRFGALLITSLLDAGFSYVCSASGKIMASLAMERSVLCLGCQGPAGTVATHLSDPMPPRQLIKRIKDMPRLFRNQKLHHLPNISLKINSNFDLSLRLLRAHHGDDCWIGPELEAVWRHMATLVPPQLVIFELWLGEKEMIAADFGHFCAGGHSFYVATRFFHRNHPNTKVRQMQPGFVLGLSECCYLRSVGCLMWDLGGINLCPLMRYKLDLTGEPFERPIALAYFRQFRQYDSKTHPVSSVQSNSVVIPDVTFEHVKIF